MPKWKQAFEKQAKSLAGQDLITELTKGRTKKIFDDLLKLAKNAVAGIDKHDEALSEDDYNDDYYYRMFEVAKKLRELKKHLDLVDKNLNSKD